MASVTYQNVFKRYGDLQVISDLNISVEDGEFLVFVGPSGCGKSTSLRMLAGLEEISEGDIMIGDRIVNDVAPKDRDIAMVFQSYALYPHMTVYDNMAFGLRLRKTPKPVIEERVRGSADSLGIGHLLDRRPRQLSGGQRQRVALGRAIVREPAVFLLDEPLSNLDAKLRVEARSFISKLHQRLSTTFIYVTHDQTEAMTMGSRICVLNEGYLQQIDTPFNLYHLPANIFVAGFIGSPAMNFFDATVTRNGDHMTLETDIFSMEAPVSVAATFDDYQGEVTLGIRPEDIHDLDFPPANIDPFHTQAKVEVIEQMGNEMFLYLEDRGRNFVARTDPRTGAHVGGSLPITINMENIHLFEKVNDQSLKSVVSKEKSSALKTKSN